VHPDSEIPKEDAGANGGTLRDLVHQRVPVLGKAVARSVKDARALSRACGRVI
jgi:hypothetical protein